mmetsp:Transcript_6584/g.19853  ORF Transcript_6584/g.19853 Transcript_6584/m.19853 type:complete len:228 (-) Transcript_6584:1794-2477(-)
MQVRDAAHELSGDNASRVLVKPPTGRGANGIKQCAAAHCLHDDICKVAVGEGAVGVDDAGVCDALRQRRLRPEVRGAVERGLNLGALHRLYCDHRRRLAVPRQPYHAMCATADLAEEVERVFAEHLGAHGCQSRHAAIALRLALPGARLTRRARPRGYGTRGCGLPPAAAADALPPRCRRMAGLPSALTTAHAHATTFPRAAASRTLHHLFIEVFQQIGRAAGAELV